LRGTVLSGSKCRNWSIITRVKAYNEKPLTAKKWHQRSADSPSTNNILVTHTVVSPTAKEQFDTTFISPHRRLTERIEAHQSWQHQKYTTEILVQISEILTAIFTQVPTSKSQIISYASHNWQYCIYLFTVKITF